MSNTAKDIQHLCEAQEQNIRNVPMNLDHTSSMDDVMNASRSVFSSAGKDFLSLSHHTMMGSWIAGQPLVMQLFKQPRLTVDLTLEHLKDKRPYGMSVANLIRMAEAGLILLNFRDYDSAMRDGFTCLKDDTVKRNIDTIFEAIPQKIYFGDVLRKKIFNRVLATRGVDRCYTTFFDAAINDLKNARACYDSLPKAHPIVQASLFRGERPHTVAAAWHWAYLNAVFPMIPIHAYEDGTTNVQARAKELYSIAANATSGAHSEEKTCAIAQSYVELMTFLRISHLNFTAPITASCGTTYNMLDVEFGQSASLLRQQTDTDIFADEEFLRVLLFLVQWDGRAIINEEYVRNVEGYVFTEDAHQLLQNDNELGDIIARLSDSNQHEAIMQAYGMMTSFNTMLMQEGDPTHPNTLATMIREFPDAITQYNAAKTGRLRFLFSDDRRELVHAWTPAAIGLVNHVIGVSLSPVASYLLEEVIASIINVGLDVARDTIAWKRPCHSLMYSMHKTIAGGRQ